MNLGIFIFTLARLISPHTALTLFFMIVVMPALLGLIPSTAQTDITDLIASALFQSILPMIIGYMLVSDHVANSKNLNDGEYLSLMFTRPVSRSSYVVSKWLAGSLGVTICVCIAYTSFIITSWMGGHVCIAQPLDFANIVLNCLSAVALVVLVSSVPMRLGVFLLVAIFYISGLGPLFSSFSLKATGLGQSGLATIAYTIGAILNFMQSLLHQAIDLTDLLDSVSFSWSTLINYLSNLTLYLVLSIVILSRREFYYASE